MVMTLTDEEVRLIEALARNESRRARSIEQIAREQLGTIRKTDKRRRDRKAARAARKRNR
jgi:hypothetical protein